MHQNSETFYKERRQIDIDKTFHILEQKEKIGRIDYTSLKKKNKKNVEFHLDQIIKRDDYDLYLSSRELYQWISEAVLNKLPNTRILYGDDIEIVD